MDLINKLSEFKVTFSGAPAIFLWLFLVSIGVIAVSTLVGILFKALKGA